MCAETLNFLSDLFLHASSYERTFSGNVWNVPFQFSSEPYTAIGTTQNEMKLDDLNKFDFDDLVIYWLYFILFFRGQIRLLHLRFRGK